MLNSFFDECKKQRLLIVAMFYVSCKIVCNPLFFRRISVTFFGTTHLLTGSALVFSLVYVLSDVIVLLSNKKTGAVIVLFGVMFDGIFSYMVYLFANFSIPIGLLQQNLASTYAVNLLGNGFWSLWYHGVSATILASLIEIFIFSFIYKKTSNFFVSTVISISITLITHNSLTDYPMLKSDPNAWHIILGGVAMNIVFMIGYASIISIALYINSKNRLEKVGIMQ